MQGANEKSPAGTPERLHQREAAYLGGELFRNNVYIFFVL